MGHAVAIPHQTITARLTKDFFHKGDRPTYFPATVSARWRERWTEPTAWQGSADLAGFASGECLICFPAGAKNYRWRSSATNRVEISNFRQFAHSIATCILPHDSSCG